MGSGIATRRESRSPAPAAPVLGTDGPPGDRAAGARQSLHRRRLGLLLVTLVVVAVALTAAVVVLTVQYWPRRYGATWTSAQSVFFAAGWVSVAAGQLVGLWLWWRAPRNPTGRWLWLAGLSLGVWFVGGYWPARWAALLTLVVFAMRPALAMAFLGWPTGRPDRRLRRWIAAFGVFGLLDLVGVGLFAGRATTPAWPRSPLAPFDVSWVGPTVGSALGWLAAFLPAALVVGLLIRQRRRLPVDARRLVTPITVAGIVVAASDLVTVPISDLAAQLLHDNGRQRETVLGVVNLTQNYGQVAVAAVGLLVAAVWRRRVVRAGDRTLEIDLGGAAPVAEPSVAVQHLLGDPSARVLFRQLGDRWVDDRGAPANPDDSRRVITPAVDENGNLLAMIETDARRPSQPMLLDVAAATIVGRLENERAAALAAARLIELTTLQHHVLDATDAARRRLERDLHDGAQQRLVGLALTASLSARDHDPEALPVLRAELAAARDELLDLLDDAPPAVLTAGLAGAFRALAATTPVALRVQARGDLDGEDPLAATLWFVASEAVANAVKHAAATELMLELSVEPSLVSLRLVDDGRGGASIPPSSLATRVADADGELSFRSQPGHGTEVVARFARTRAGAVAG